MYTIDPKAIKKVYSGNHKNNSCRCGCLGKYYYASEFAALENWSSPRPAADHTTRIEPEEISDRMVAKVSRILSERFAEIEAFDYGGCAGYDLVLENGRTYTAYLED